YPRASAGQARVHVALSGVETSPPVLTDQSILVRLLPQALFLRHNCQEATSVIAETRRARVSRQGYARLESLYSCPVRRRGCERAPHRRPATRALRGNDELSYAIYEIWMSRPGR